MNPFPARVHGSASIAFLVLQSPTLTLSRAVPGRECRRTEFRNKGGVMRRERRSALRLAVIAGIVATAALAGTLGCYAHHVGGARPKPVTRRLGSPRRG
jgi:hypothetical protein